MDLEIWKDIKGFEGKYMISNHGRLKSFSVKVLKRFPDGFITHGSIDTSGYRGHNLGTSKSDRKYTRIHTLVASYFIEKHLESECVNHIDGNKLNNHHSNLEWTTLGDNIRHAVKIGLHDLKGENHPHSKLTKSDVYEMKELRKQGWMHQKIADKFGVCRRQAGDVINGVNWGWIK